MKRLALHQPLETGVIEMTRFLLPVLVIVAMISGCAPEPGSKEWCDQLKEKSAGDWTANEAVEYTKSCVFKDD